MMTSGEQRPRHALEDLLHAAPDGGQPSLGQVEQLDGEVRAGQERMRRVARLLLTFRGAGQHDVPGPQLALGQAEEQAAGADLDVVRVRADGEHGQRLAGRRVKGQRQHGSLPLRRRGGRRNAGQRPAFLAAPERSGSQTIHGHCPRWYISSSWARSLTVSAGDQ